MGRKLTSAITRSADSSKYTLYTVPSKHSADWSLIYVLSLTGTETPTVYWYDSHLNVEYKVISAKNLGIGDSMILQNSVVVLQQNDEIRVQNGTSTQDATYLVTVELEAHTTTQFHQ